MAQLNNLIVTGDARINGDLIHNSGMVAFGTCSTAAGTAAKEVVINDPAWSLKVGDIIGVKFTASNTASSCTINVNGSGAKQIWYNTAVYTSTSGNICGTANRFIYYIYDGTYWSWLNSGLESNDNNVPAAISWTAAGTAAKTATQNYYTLIKGYDLVTFQYANSAASAITLNINGKGAKPIYINGTASSASNYTLPAGCYLVYFDGTNYYFRTDGLITGSITGNAATVNGLTVETAVPANAKFTDTNTTYTFATGDSNGQIKVTPSSGSATNVSVKGLAAAAYKGVDTSMTKTSTSTNVPTTKAVADLISTEIGNVSVDGMIVSSNDTVENIVSLTKAEYDALTTKEKNTLYNITDDVSANGNIENATQTTDGLMSSADKIKLDGITASADSVSFTQSLTSGTAVGTLTINGTGTTLYAPAAASKGTITTQITSHGSGNMTANNTDKGTISFSATGPGSGWYPTCVTANANTTVVLVNGVTLRGIAMTSAGNNSCSGSIYFQGNGGGNCRGTTTYYVTWAKIS